MKIEYEKSDALDDLINDARILFTEHDCTLDEVVKQLEENYEEIRKQKQENLIKNNTEWDPYLQEFKSIEDMDKEFETKIPRDINILISWYGYGSYCGDSYVLYEKDGELYENNAGHCSCYGLEGQWGPIKVCLEYLENIDKQGNKFDNEYDGSEKASKMFHDVVQKLLWQKEKNNGEI